MCSATFWQIRNAMRFFLCVLVGIEVNSIYIWHSPYDARFTRNTPFASRRPSHWSTSMCPFRQAAEVSVYAVQQHRRRPTCILFIKRPCLSSTPRCHNDSNLPLYPNTNTTHSLALDCVASRSSLHGARFLSMRCPADDRRMPCLSPNVCNWLELYTIHLLYLFQVDDFDT